MSISLQEPCGYTNAKRIPSKRELEKLLKGGKMYHIAQFKRKCVCYFHHFILDKRGTQYVIYECAFKRSFWKFKGVSEVREKTVTNEDLETTLDFESGLWLIGEYGNDYLGCFERATTLIGEKQYMPSGETCETFVRYVLHEKGDSFQLL